MPNSIGMSNFTWEECFECSKPGACTEVPGGHGSDQFAAYQQSTIAAAVSSPDVFCEFIPFVPLSFTSSLGDNSRQSVSCSYPDAALDLNITVDGAILGLEYIEIEPYLQVGQYTVKWREAAGSLLVNVTVSNIGSALGIYKLAAVRCCLTLAVDGYTCQGVNATDSAWVGIQPSGTSALLSEIAMTEHTKDVFGACDYELVNARETVQSFLSIPFYSSSKDGLHTTTGSESPVSAHIQDSGIEGLLSFTVSVTGSAVGTATPAFLVR